MAKVTGGLRRIAGPWPLRLRLILAFLLVGVPSMLGAAYLASTLIASAFQKNVGQWLSETARFVTVEVTEREGDAAQVAATLAAMVGKTTPGTPQAFEAALRTYHPILSAYGFDAMMIYDASGAIRYSTLPFDPAKPLPPKAVQAAFTGTLRGKSVLVVGATQALSPPADGLFLFVGDALDASSFSSLRATPSLQLDFFAIHAGKAVKLFETSKIAAVPSAGMIARLARTSDPILLDEAPGDLFEAALMGLRDQDGEVAGVVFCGVGGEEGLIGQKQEMQLLWAAFVLGALVFVLAGGLVSARLVKPLRALSRGVRLVASGDFSQRVPETGDKETVDLARRFNAMAAELEKARSREAELRRKERMSTLGEAATVLAHEVRNPLGIIKTSSDLVRARAKLGPKEEELLDYVSDEVDRIDNLLTEVLDFAHPKEPYRSSLPASELVERIQVMATPEIEGKGLSLLVEDRSEGAKVSVDRDQIHEAVLNLVLNAMDAAGPGGRIVIRLSATPETVAIEVADNGPGVKPELRARIFNPFFTTKAKGTGLGLAKVATVVEAHGGEIDYRDEPGGGACFRMTFPRDMSDPAAASPSPEPAA
jgi:signal transduction histidine kinase